VWLSLEVVSARANCFGLHPSSQKFIVNPEPLLPLPADPKRQADAMFRGCEYQVWQTVNAWTDLKSDQLLFVEGAEDFDLVAPDGAVAIQVKNAVQPISLRSKDVQDAIQHYWELRASHSNTRVYLRFLTRATIAVERDAPFGQGVAGLSLWMRPELTDQECKALSDFLASLDRVGQDLKQWLPAASPAQIRGELIEGITWETFAEGVEYVERTVKRRLATRGETLGIPPSVATRVAGRLFNEIWKTLRKKTDRFLDWLRLQELWEEETRVSVPLVEHQQMLRLLVAKESASHVFTRQFQNGAPPFAGVVAQRSRLVDEIYERLRSNGFLHIHGSTRMGKTTLAKLVVRRHEGQWLWWSAARRPGGEIARNLRILIRELNDQSGLISVVLDDLDFTATAALEFEETLGELIATIRGRRGNLLITAQKPLSIPLLHAFGLSADQMTTVPNLSQEEVAEIAEGLGCPEENREKWTAVVRALTAGHPHLVAVHLLTLRGNNWPAPTTNALNGVGAKVEEEKRESRQLLNSLPLEQREALYRLSVFPGVFRRDHGIAILSSPPPLQQPGDLFDPLLGPWLESLHGGYFTLSPLISGCAKQAFSPVDFRNLQIAALNVLHECDPRRLIDGSSAFRLAWELRDVSKLASFALSWASMDEDSRAKWAEYVGWFIFKCHKPGETLLPENPMVSLLLRQHQLNLAVNARPEQAIRVYRSWRAECASRTLSALERITISSTVLPQTELSLPGAEVILLISEFAAAMTESPGLAAQLPTAPDLPELSWLSDVSDAVSTLGLFVCWRCKTITFLDELLDGLEATSTEVRTRILQGFALDEGHLRLAFSRTWITESERDNPDWNRCVSVFEKAYQLGLAWESKNLALAAISAIAVVQDEYLRDSAKAHAMINQLAGAAGLDSHQIDDRRANIYFSEGKFTEAEAHWSRALSRWPAPTNAIDQSAAFAARSAGVAAAKIGKWDAAAAWFEQVQKWLPEPKDRPFAAGALADAAYAFWKAGKPKEAVAAIIEAWTVADSLHIEEEDLRAFATQKRVAHLIAWFHAVISGARETQLLEPIAGMCSNPDVSEKIRELAPAESAAVWIFLMRMERKCDAGDKAASLGKPIVEASKSILTRPIIDLEIITRAILSGDVADLPKKCIGFTVASRETALAYPKAANSFVQGVEPEMFNRKDRLIGAPLFLVGVASAASVGVPLEALLTSWRASVVTNPFSKDWNDWFSEIESALTASPSAATAAFWSGTGAIESIALGVLNILLGHRCSPEQLFAAHARLLCLESASPWFRETGQLICRLVERAWMHAIETPALLRQPRFSIPEIRAACSGAGTGLQKAARILLAARNAISTTLSSEVRASVENLAH
jgi:tetratricopeptide (TPR) repeat protein